MLRMALASLLLAAPLAAQDAAPGAIPMPGSEAPQVYTAPDLDIGTEGLVEDLRGGFDEVPGQAGRSADTVFLALEVEVLERRIAVLEAELDAQRARTRRLEERLDRAPGQTAGGG